MAVTRKRATIAATLLLVAAFLGWKAYPGLSAKDTLPRDYLFRKGYPVPDTVQRAYDAADLNRAMEAYRFFYPTVSAASIYNGNLEAGMVPNETFGILEATPRQLIFTANSDTPYAVMALDLRPGPLVVELPPGPLMGVVNDLNERYVMDLGLSGPDAGKGGKHIVLPPGRLSEVPTGYYTGRSTTYRAILIVRALPSGGDTKSAIDLIKTVKLYPLNPTADWKTPHWITLSGRAVDLTPLRWEANLEYWETLQRVIDSEPPYRPYRNNYGELAALGIVKGKPFAPDARMKGVLEQAAQTGNAQMRVQSFADRRPDRAVWSDRKWEWVTLRPENATFDALSYKDLDAREKWFFQAQIESPAIFRRAAGAGPLYWLAARDADGVYLDGGRSYKLTVPQPVPAKLFWSVTVYDAETRSQIQTGQNKAALRSLDELKDAGNSGTATLYFGPTPPAGHEGRWVQTTPGRSWFAYFRIYGPDGPAFDGSWEPGDFEPVR